MMMGMIRRVRGIMGAVPGMMIVLGAAYVVSIQSVVLMRLSDGTRLLRTARTVRNGGDRDVRRSGSRSVLRVPKAWLSITRRRNLQRDGWPPRQREL